MTAEPLQGKTHDHPGPRKKVPMAVSTINSNKNHVMIQNESGFLTSQRRNPCAVCGSVCAARNMNAATMTVGTSATQTSKTDRKIQKTTTTMPKIRKRLALSRNHSPSASTLMLK